MTETFTKGTHLQKWFLTFVYFSQDVNTERSQFLLKHAIETVGKRLVCHTWSLAPITDINAHHESL